MPRILLSTLNARYIHTSLGLRYLKVNMQGLSDDTSIMEFTINQRIEQIAETILATNAEILGLGVYIWNARETLELVSTLKILKPKLIIILGGPEVSYEYKQQTLVHLADFLITGQADLTFGKVCRQILENRAPQQKVINAQPEPLPFIKLPYSLYSDKDILHRVIYVEASRGCPFKCEFCLSALDKTATAFDLDLFLTELEKLINRGARHFKFVDRTFNLKTASCLKILTFFLEKLKERDIFLHFELIPDRLPDSIKTMLPLFPPGSLQFEIGVQTFNPNVQERISRRQDNQKTEANLKWIREHTDAHIHADLIFGLPGENLHSFAQGFNRLVNLNPHEIQLGILKRLRGTPITRHTQAFDMRYNPLPPYNLLSNKDIDFPMMQQVSRFARYWDLIANSGRFSATLPVILRGKPFENFSLLSDFIYKHSGQTHRIALRKLFDFLFLGMTTTLALEEVTVLKVLREDFAASGHRDRFNPPQSQLSAPADPGCISSVNHDNRQQRHRAEPPAGAC